MFLSDRSNKANEEPSRSRRGLSAGEAREQRISQRDRKQKGRRLSAQASCWADV
jgi:hypothetical protein